MRLLQLDSDGDIALTSDLRLEDVPPYAILSHTWGRDDEEVVFADVQSGRGKSKAGYEKIRFCAQRAKADGIYFFWIDTCCIDKANHTELSESINSMFRWYQEAVKCYVYLADVSSRKRDHEGDSRQLAMFRDCRWLTRGWTLQELLAPGAVEFYTREGDLLGDKRTLSSTLEQVTGIPRRALSGEASLSDFPIRARMSWAASRTTTKPEDKVYCLLGIFAVFMSPLYGEGEEHAFGRLKDAIGKSYNNQLDEIGPSLIRTDSIALLTRNAEGSTRQDRYKDLMASLRFDQMDARRTSIKTAFSTTCAWLLQNPIYTEWIDPDRDGFERHCGFMWIKGKPGAGKSTLVKFAHAHAQKLKSKDEILTCFFFNARGDALEKSVTGMYRSLLWQILDKAKDILSIFDDVPESFHVQSSEWNIDTLRELFAMAVGRLGQRTLKCFIDALDECDEADVRDMIIHLEDLGQMSPGRCSILLASRHYPTIVIRRGRQLVLEDENGHDDDLTKYLQNYLRIDPGEFFENILARTLEKANGVFMWAILVVPILNEEYRRGRSFAVEKRLDEIPKGLSELFRDILTRDSTDMDTLLLCLQWILFAKRPLTREEFYFAMLAGSDTETPAVWNQQLVTQADMDRFVHNSSKGLAEITNPARSTKPIKLKRARDRSDIVASTIRVQFIHESVRDFLIKDGGLCELWPELASDPASLSHDALKDCCRKYLRVELDKYIPKFDQYDRSVASADTRNLRANLRITFPFLQYAVQHILHHADQAANYVLQQDFLKSFSTQHWARVSNQFVASATDRYSRSVGLLYILADSNAPSLVRIACHMGFQMPSPRERFEHPFFAALAWEYWDAVRAVLDPAASSDLDEIIDSVKPHALTKNIRKVPPLLWALQEGIEPLARYLVERVHVADIERRDHHRRGAVSWAAMRGYTDVIIQLLSKGAEIHTVCTKSLAPLHYAAQHDHFEAVKLLLDQGAEIHAVCTRGLTPLHYAAEYGHCEVVKLLLDRGADINHRDSNLTALCHAVIANNHAMTKLLLDRGAKIHFEDSGPNALHQAVGTRRNCQLTKLLLDRGAQVNSTDDFKQTSLHEAAVAGYYETSMLLLDRGACVDLIDNSKQTSLHKAVEAGEYRIAELLLDRGAQVDLTDDCKQTSLHKATAAGHYRVAELLLNRGAQVNSVDVREKSSLHVAAAKGYYEIAELLLDRGARIDLRCFVGETALNLAVDAGHNRSARLLAAQVVRIHIRDEEGQTTLRLVAYSDLHEPETLALDPRYGSIVSAASAEGHQLAIRLRPDDHKSRKWVNRFLSIAFEGGHYEVVQWLLGASPDFDSLRNKSDQLSHSSVSRTEHIADLVRLLLNAWGRDVFGADCEKLFAIWAGSYEEVVKLILGQRVSLNVRRQWYSLILRDASAQGDEEAVKVLLDIDDCVSAQIPEFLKGSDAQNEALLDALKAAHHGVVMLLLDAGADVNARGGQCESFYEVADLLVSNGADDSAPQELYQEVAEPGLDVPSHHGNGKHALQDLQM